jgi:hypothetical protein
MIGVRWLFDAGGDFGVVDNVEAIGYLLLSL